MARIRTIKPEFWADEKLAPLPAVTRLVFLGLISQADDAGRLVDSVRLLDGLLFPETEDSCAESLETLDDLGIIERGVTASGQKVIQLVNWHHQKIDKPNLSSALPPIAIGEGSEITRRRVPPKLRDAIFDRDGGVCQNCGQPVRREKRDRYDSGRDLAEVDHIIALADGGTNDPENLQLLCLGCNRRKAGDAVRRRNKERSATCRGSVADVSAPHISTGTSTGGSGSSTSTSNRTTTTRAGGNEPEDDDVNASEARCAMWAEFEDRLTDEPELSEAAHRKATAAVEGIINGEARTAWLDPRGMPVPWTDRPRLFKLALAERIASGGNLHNILRGLIIPREYDPFPVKQSTDPKPGSEAERVKQTPGAETPGRGRGRTTASEDTAPRQYIPSAEDEAARKQRREQEEAEQRQREDSLIRGWEMQDEVTAKRVRAEAALAVGENKFVPAHLKERATVEEYRQRVLAILKHDGDEAAA